MNNFNFASYSDFMKSHSFWDNFKSDAEYCLTIQTDGCLCKNSLYNIQDFFKYDYVGGYGISSGYYWRHTHYLHNSDAYQCFNGGFSLRNIAISRKVLDFFPPKPTESWRGKKQIHEYPEDLYYICGMLKLKMNVAIDKYGTNFCTHTTYISNTFCVHDYLGVCKNRESFLKCRKNRELELFLKYCPEYKNFLKVENDLEDVYPPLIL